MPCSGGRAPDEKAGGRHRDGAARQVGEVPAQGAEGRSNGSIARELFVSEAAVLKHVGAILQKLDLPVDGESHRRVLAVLAYLRG
jgi:DNA-binding NarL/FixJ family response regulator